MFGNIIKLRNKYENITNNYKSLWTIQIIYSVMFMVNIKYNVKYDW